MDTKTIYTKNLEYLKSYNKTLYKIIKKTKSTNIQININEDGINIEKNNKYLYPRNVTTHMSSKLEQFFQNPTSFFKSPTLARKDPLTTSIQDYYLEKVESKIPPKQTQNISYHKNLDSLPILLLFGIGTGQEIEQIINSVDIKSLIIIDEDFSIIKASMHLINWQAIFEYFSRDSYSLQFEINSNPLVAASNIFFKLSTQKIHCSYYINYYSSYITPFFQKVYNQINDNYQLLFHGWGFYDDELLSLQHTIENINDNRPIFTNNKKLPKDTSVFIIGTGPSLDDDIENIKKHQDKAIIFSCGTALKVLEANNIIPDYHFESERPTRMYDYISNSISKAFLKKVNFIGVNVVYPEVLKLFKSAKIFFRVNDCGSSITNNTIPKFEYCNPTVVNASLLFASAIGFKNIYMFGTDMGYRDEKNHHSKYSSYSDTKNVISKLKPTTIKQTFPGNFNKSEQFLSTEVFAWCKQRAEYCIADFNITQKKHLNYFNCSDGAFIEHTNSKRSQDICLHNSIDKAFILDSLEKNFTFQNNKFHEALKSNFEKEKNIAIKTINDILTIIEQYGKIKNYSDFFAVMDKTYPLIYEKIHNKNSSLVFSLIRGTTLHIYSTLYTHALLAEDINLSFEYINHGLLVVVEFLMRVKSDINEYSIF